MTLNLNGENRVISEIEQPGGVYFPPFGFHPPQPARPQASGSQPRPAAQAHRILFIEDDRIIAEMYRMKLDAEGFEVEIAYDGESGVRQAITNPPDLVVLDILLPRLDGIEVLRALRTDRSTRSIPVLILSNAVGFGGREDEARSLGIVDWVVKANVTPAGLVTRVNRILAD